MEVTDTKSEYVCIANTRIRRFGERNGYKRLTAMPVSFSAEYMLASDPLARKR